MMVKQVDMDAMNSMMMRSVIRFLPWKMGENFGGLNLCSLFVGKFCFGWREGEG